MQVELTKAWTVTFTADEMALVLMALGGRLREEEDSIAAKELGDTMTVQRQKQALALAQAMTKHVNAMCETKNKGTV